MQIKFPKKARTQRHWDSAFITDSAAPLFRPLSGSDRDPCPGQARLRICSTDVLVGGPARLVYSGFGGDCCLTLSGAFLALSESSESHGPGGPGQAGLDQNE